MKSFSRQSELGELNGKAQVLALDVGYEFRVGSGCMHLGTVQGSACWCSALLGVHVSLVGTCIERVISCLYMYTLLTSLA